MTPLATTTTPTASTNPTPLASTNATPPASTILDQSGLNEKVKRSSCRTEYTFQLKDITLERVLKLISDNRELVSHPVVETFLSAIWQKSKVRNLFIVLFWAYLVFVVLSAILLGYIGNPIWQPKGKLNNNNNHVKCRFYNPKNLCTKNRTSSFFSSYCFSHENVGYYHA